MADLSPPNLPLVGRPAAQRDILWSPAKTWIEPDLTSTLNPRTLSPKT
jgi:hypothetical protein